MNFSGCTGKRFYEKNNQECLVVISCRSNRSFENLNSMFSLKIVYCMICGKLPARLNGSLTISLDISNKCFSNQGTF